MKISTNIPNNVLHTSMQSGSVKKRSATEPSAHAAAQNTAARFAPTRAGLQQEAASDALAIAQMSHDIIQRAMEAVSRLKNIAAETMTTGRVNTAELEMIAGIIPEGLDAAKFTPVSSADITFQSGVLDTKNDTAQVKILAENMTGGFAPNDEYFETIENRLIIRETEIGKTIEALIQRMRGGMDFSPTNTPSVSVIKDSIINDSSLALVAQGNINRNVISHYLS